MAQILINSRLCAEGHRPICQDTGIVTVFLKIGMDVRWDATLSIQEMVDEGVRRAYRHPDNTLPTTATRMDTFTEQVLRETGLLGMIGKAERGPAAIEAIQRHRSVYLMAVGGAAYLVSKAIKAARVVGFADLGMEAIYEFEVKDMPVTVAVDSAGESVHRTGPRQWQARIGKIPVVVE